MLSGSEGEQWWEVQASILQLFRVYPNTHKWFAIWTCWVSPGSWLELGRCDRFSLIPLVSVHIDLALGAIPGSSLVRYQEIVIIGSRTLGKRIKLVYTNRCVANSHSLKKKGKEGKWQKKGGLLIRELNGKRSCRQIVIYNKPVIDQCACLANKDLLKF